MIRPAGLFNTALAKCGPHTQKKGSTAFVVVIEDMCVCECLCLQLDSSIMERGGDGWCDVFGDGAGDDPTLDSAASDWADVAVWFDKWYDPC